MKTQTTTTTNVDIASIFNSQLKNQQNIANTTSSQRSKKLKKLHKLVEEYRPKVKDALYKDYKKHPSEVDLTEIYPVTGELKHTRKHIHRWMQKEHVGTPLALLGSSSWIHYEPKGVVLIVSPWNFPFNLTIGPLVSAVAAGNCVMIKPSEHTPHASSLMKEMLAKLFDENEVAVIEGGVEQSKDLLKLPFHHIFFTGAPSIGKIVMEAAAKNLTSVTLELGGKSPTIIDESANVKSAAKRITWGKYLNNGQICIAPDYLFVHESKKDEFVKEANKCINNMYGDDIIKSDSYCRMVNNRHFQRVKSYLDNGIEHGMSVTQGGKLVAEEDYIAPTIVEKMDDDADIANQEIFGPILPIYTFKNIEDVVKVINKKERPLALYIYSKKRKNINYVINNTRAGGTCINHNALHFFNNNLPFGGVNNSGIGQSHGEFGFKEFSNPRSIFKQWSPMSAIETMMPPYTGLKQKMIDLSIKWF